MRILFLVHSFNSLAQRLYVELAEAGHELSVEYDINDETTREAVALFRPDVVLAPFLKRAIPEDVWRALPCLVVHPGVRGDRGPNALDWAILRREQSWGVTIIEAEAEMDAGPVWAWREFEMRHAPKSSIYRNEVTETAVITVFEALAMIEARDFRPTRLDLTKREIRPGADIQSDDEILAFVRQFGTTIFHPSCTAKMGRKEDPMAVVD
ncbi:MAG TPA: GMC oxidoreductase, partial [Hyphomicrobiales bacterium]|nr:GMC oxidoreductase [Hyphomicrobiales bacterium]